MTDLPARLSNVAREAIHRRLQQQRKGDPIPLSRVLREVRAELPSLRESDDDLINHIVIEATDNGLFVHFDSDGSQR